MNSQNHPQKVCTVNIRPLAITDLCQRVSGLHHLIIQIQPQQILSHAFSWLYTKWCGRHEINNRERQTISNIFLISEILAMFNEASISKHQVLNTQQKVIENFHTSFRYLQSVCQSRTHSTKLQEPKGNSYKILSFQSYLMYSLFKVRPCTAISPALVPSQILSSLFCSCFTHEKLTVSTAWTQRPLSIYRAV